MSRDQLKIRSFKQDITERALIKHNWNNNGNGTYSKGPFTILLDDIGMFLWENLNRTDAISWDSFRHDPHGLYINFFKGHKVAL